MEWFESRYEQHEERDDRDDSPNQRKDRKKSSQGEEKDHRIKERERSKRSNDDVSKEREREAKDAEKERGSGRERRKDDKDEQDKRKDDRDERDKDRSRDSNVREKDHDREKNREKERERDRDRKDRAKEKDREKDRDVEKDSERGRDKERGKDKNKDRDKEREKEWDRGREKERDRDREKHRDREKGRENHKDIDKEKEKAKGKIKEKEREADGDKEKSRDRASRRSVEEDYEWGKDKGKDNKTKLDDDNNRDKDAKQGKLLQHTDGEQIADDSAHKAHLTTAEVEERILKMKQERSKKKTEDISEVSAWVNRSRKLEEKKNAEKEKALLLSRIFEEQDKIVQDDSEDEETTTTQHHNLAGVKILHGIDKVMEGGAVVLTLKDQNILADGGINEEVDMLENVEIGEQKRRDEAYKAAKKKVGVYDDKFNDDPSSEKKILPQYDDPSTDEGVTIDERGRINSEAEKKLEELRKSLQGGSTNTRFEDVNFSGKISSDYYTPEEMMLFKKPKKKKSLRKKDKLDIDALEAEAVSAGLGVGDLGSRNDVKRQAIREEQDRAEPERRNNAYQTALAKAHEASKSLRLEQTLPIKSEEEENLVFADDDEDFHKAIERARKIAVKKKEEETPSGPEAVALLAATIVNSQTADEQNPSGELQENKVVFTEMEEFVWGLQLEEEAQKPDSEDVFMDEDEEPKASNEEIKDKPGGWTEVKETDNDEQPSKEEEEEIVPDGIIHEVAVGKGLSGALKLLKERGTLKESIDWGGRNMDKKKSKLVGIVGDDEPGQQVHQKKDGTRTSSSSHSKETHNKVYQEKDIRIERTDEFGRILTPKEAFRQLSHKFHGKGPGKMKQEKRMKQFQEELKLKQMKSSDTPSSSVERMREAQAKLKTPYLVLSGHVKPGQTSDPRSGFATVEKDPPGGLTPMLGDRKVEHFLGIKRKPEPPNSGASKKPKN